VKTIDSATVLSGTRCRGDQAHSENGVHLLRDDRILICAIHRALQDLQVSVDLADMCVYQRDLVLQGRGNFGKVFLVGLLPVR
jgi:hypothetical protein